MPKIKPQSSHRKVIETALARLRFRRIGKLLYLDAGGDEIQEFTNNNGILICVRDLPTTVVAGNRVAKQHQIWLHPDGTLHKYRYSATWETSAYGCSERTYVGPVDYEEISMDELIEALETNLSLEEEDLDPDYLAF